jgi:hypothetical protein
MHQVGMVSYRQKHTNNMEQIHFEKNSSITENKKNLDIQPKFGLLKKLKNALMILKMFNGYVH